MSHLYSPASYVPIETRHQKQSPNCVFYLNGDENFSGSKLCISNRIRTFDGIKDEISRSLLENRRSRMYPFTGYVRNVFTPTGGTRIRSIDEFKDGEHYVAATDDRFRPLNYRDISDQPRPPHKKGYRKIDINRIFTPVQHACEERLRRKSGKSQYLNEHNKGLILRVHINGMNEKPACPVSIQSKHKDNMGKIKEEIQTVLNDKVYHTPPIHRIYKIQNSGGYVENFSEVTDATKLEANEHLLVMRKYERHIEPKFYSASGKKNFKVATSPRAGQYYLYDTFPMMDKGFQKHNRSLNKHKPLPSIGSSSKKSDSLSPMSNPPSYAGSRARNKNRGPGGGRHIKDVDYDKDEGGVYRSRHQNNARGAQQVKDTYETRTERPIDDMEAEIVAEEEIHAKEKSTPIPPGTELNKQPSEQNKESMDTDYQATQTKEVIIDDETLEDNEPLPEAKDNADDDDGNESIPDNKDEGDLNDSNDRISNVNVQADGRRTQEHTPESRKRNGADSPRKAGSFGDEENDRYDDGNDRNEDYNEESFNQFNRHSPAHKRSSSPRASTPTSRSVEAERANIQREREEEAATRLQAGIQGQLTRREFEARQHDMRQGEEKREEQERREEEERRMLEAEQDDLEEQQRRAGLDGAATKIQAGFRGYQSRKEMNAMKAQVRDNSVMSDRRVREDTAAIRIQAGYKGYKARRDMKPRRADAARKRREEEAATHIQAGYHGYKTRQEYKYKNNEISKGAHEEIRDDKENLAASRIQAGYRGYRIRKENKTACADIETNDDVDQSQDNDTEKLTEEEAAYRIQAGFMGYKARNEYADVRKTTEEGEHRRNKAATEIQAGYRGYQSRKRYADRKKESHRPELDDKALDNAATKIQAGFRGYKTRKEYIDKVKTQALDVEGSVGTNQYPKPAPFQPSIFREDLFMPGSKGFHASYLQAAFRGYITRKTFQVMYVSSLATHVGSSKILGPSNTDHNFFYSETNVTNLQAAFKGYQARKSNSSLSEQTTLKIKPTLISKQNNFYATKIQALCHGYMVRQFAKLNKSNSPVLALSGPSISEMEKELSDASNSSSIALSEGSGKSYWEDTNVKMVSDKIKWTASCKIQSAFKSYKTRHNCSILNAKAYLNETGVRISNNKLDWESSHIKSLVSSKSINSPQGEVEDEVENVREIEDDECELNMMKIRCNGVSQLHAAFRAYKARRDAAEFLSGGGQLVDMAKIKHDVSALKKEFRFKSAKTRRLGLFDFVNNESETWARQWNDDMIDGENRNMAQTSIQTDSRASKACKSSAVVSPKKGLDVKSVSTIQASIKGYSVRKGVSLNRKREQYCSRIRAAIDGFKTRKVEQLRILKQINSPQQCQNYKVTKVELATRLQAVFVAFLTRKRFKSVTELVGQEIDPFSNFSYSLSETDDFKLRCKAAFDAQRLGLNIDKLSMNYQNEFKVQHSEKSVKSSNSKIALVSNSVFSKQTQHCMIKGQPKSNDKSHIDAYRNKYHMPKALNIQSEICVDQNTGKAASLLQATARGYLQRQKVKSGNKEIVMKERRNSLSSKSSKVSVKSVKYDIRELVRVKTSSVKLEAEKRKILAEQTKQKERSLAKENTASVKKQAIKLKSKKNYWEANDKLDTSFVPKSVLCKSKQDDIQDKSSTHRDKDSAAVIIQKVYRGYKVRQSYKTSASLNDEYKMWNRCRNDSAVVIQATWRGYKDRKYLKEQSSESLGVSDSELVKVPAQNKADKNRANFRHTMASNLQMVFKAAQIRRKIKLNAARLWREKFVFASKIQALSRAYITRNSVRSKDIATSIQASVKGYNTRANMKNIMSDRGSKETLTKAATKIQTAVRGLAERKCQRDKLKAANLIIAAFKSYKRISEVKVFKEKEKFNIENKAAFTIQAGYRRYLNWLESSKPREEKTMTQKMAATHLQACVRGKNTRTQVKLLQQKCIASAVVIQSHYRGYKCRRIMKKRFEQEQTSALKIQAAFRGYIGRKRAKDEHVRAAQNVVAYIVELVTNTAYTSGLRSNASAARIQASYNGFLARKKLALKQQEYLAEAARVKERRVKLKQHAAATNIQATITADRVRHKVAEQKQLGLKTLYTSKIVASFSGFRTRTDIKQQKATLTEIKPLDSAVIEKTRESDLYNKMVDTIQSIFKGYLYRRQIYDRLKKKHSDEDQAAIKIQTAYRNFHNRKFLAKKNNQLHAVTKTIQAAFKGHLHRKQNQKQDVKIARTDDKLVKDRHEAANIIMMAFRHYQKRKAKAASRIEM